MGSAVDSRMHLPQHLHNLCAQHIEIRINLRQVSRRLVLVEVAVEGDLVADDADLLIPLVAFARIDPGVFDMRRDFFGEVRLVHGIHVRSSGGLGGKRNIFGVAEIAVRLELDDAPLVFERPVHRIGLRLEHLLDHGFGLGVRPGDGIEELLPLLRVQREPGLLERRLQRPLKRVEVIALFGPDHALKLHGLGEELLLHIPGLGSQQVLHLPFLQVREIGLDAGTDFGFDLCELTVALISPILTVQLGHFLHHGVQRAARKAQLRKAVVGELHRESERALHGNTPVPKHMTLEDLAAEGLLLGFLLRGRRATTLAVTLVLGELRIEAVGLDRLELSKGASNQGDVAIADLLPLGTQALAHLLVEMHAVDELYLALALGVLLVRQHPDVGRDAGVVEHVRRQSDDGLQQVALQNVATDFALATARATCEQG